MSKSPIKDGCSYTCQASKLRNDRERTSDTSQTETDNTEAIGQMNVLGIIDTNGQQTVPLKAALVTAKRSSWGYTTATGVVLVSVDVTARWIQSVKILYARHA